MKKLSKIEKAVIKLMPLQNAYESIEPRGDWMYDALLNQDFDDEKIEDVLDYDKNYKLFLIAYIANAEEAKKQLDEMESENV